MTGNIFLSIIIPAFNEEKRLPFTLNATIDYLMGQRYSSEIIVVSDGSLDKTKEIAEGFKLFFPELKVIEYFPNKGKGAAVKMGMKVSRGDYRLFMDADMSVPIEFIDECLVQINKGNGVVIGSRALNKSLVIQSQSFFRETLGKMYGILLNTVTGLGIKDTQCGFKMFTSDTSERIFSVLVCENQLFDAEVLMLAKSHGISVVEVPVDWYHDGDSRIEYNLIKSIWVLKELWKLRQRAKILTK